MSTASCDQVLVGSYTVDMKAIDYIYTTSQDQTRSHSYCLTVSVTVKAPN